MKSENLFTGLKNLFGALALVLSVWAAMLTGFFVGNSVVIIMHADGYQPATFTVENLYFQLGNNRSTNRTYDKYYVTGTVNDQTEYFGLGEQVKGPFKTREEFEAQAHPGQKLAVLYNPVVPEKTRLRVLYPEKDFKETWKGRQKKMINTAYGSRGLAIALCLLCGAAARKTRSAVKMCVGACVFLVPAWIPLLLNLYF